MENIIRAEHRMSIRTSYLSEDGEPQGIPLVDAFGIETRFGYDYKKGGNIPYNYGNGYGVRLYGNPYIKTPMPQLPFTPSTIRRP